MPVEISPRRFASAVPFGFLPDQGLHRISHPQSNNSQPDREDLEGLGDPHNLDVLRKAFTDPDALKPGQTTEAITEQAAERFGQLADGRRVRSVPAHDAAHFLMKLMFCMFAEDIRLLKGNVFSRILENVTEQRIGGLPLPTAGAELSGLLARLFGTMSNGGYFGATRILHFNGGLFADADVIDLEPDEINKLKVLNDLDWSDVETPATMISRMRSASRPSFGKAAYAGTSTSPDSAVVSGDPAADRTGENEMTISGTGVPMIDAATASASSGMLVGGRAFGECRWKK